MNEAVGIVPYTYMHKKVDRHQQQTWGALMMTANLRLSELPACPSHCRHINNGSRAVNFGGIPRAGGGAVVSQYFRFAESMRILARLNEGPTGTSGRHAMLANTNRERYTTLRKGTSPTYIVHTITRHLSCLVFTKKLVLRVEDKGEIRTSHVIHRVCLLKTSAIEWRTKGRPEPPTRLTLFADGTTSSATAKQNATIAIAGKNIARDSRIPAKVPQDYIL